METGIIAGVIAGLAHDSLSLDFRAVMSDDASSDCAAVRLHALQLNLEPVLLAVQIVSQQRWRLVHVDDQHVDVAVIVEVAEGAAAAAVRRQ